MHRVRRPFYTDSHDTTTHLCSDGHLLAADRSRARRGIIREVAFTGGCHGNTQGIAALVRGMRAEEAAERLGGIDCRGKGTSCPDQLSRALREAL